MPRVGGPSVKPLYVLVVEDDEVDRLSVRRALQNSGHAAQPFVCTEVGSLADARQASQARRWDCIILDRALPDGDGRSLIEDDRHAESAVIFLTGSEDEGDIPQLLRSGAQDYLVKGRHDSKALCRSVEYAVERKQYERQRLSELRSDGRRFKSGKAAPPAPLEEETHRTSTFDLAEFVHFGTIGDVALGAGALAVRAIFGPPERQISRAGIFSNWWYGNLELFFDGADVLRAISLSLDDLRLRLPRFLVASGWTPAPGTRTADFLNWLETHKVPHDLETANGPTHVELLGSNGVRAIFDGGILYKLIAEQRQSRRVQATARA